MTGVRAVNLEHKKRSSGVVLEAGMTREVQSSGLFHGLTRAVCDVYIALKWPTTCSLGYTFNILQNSSG
jgi:hypothetical protein